MSSDTLDRDGVSGIFTAKPRITPSTVRRLSFAAAALVVVIWPGGGAAGGRTSGMAGATGADRPSRQDAVAVAAPHSPAVADATDRVVQARTVAVHLGQQLTELRLAAFRGDRQVLPAAAADGLARSRAQHYADEAAGALTARVADAQRALEAAEEEQRKAVAGYFAALAAATEAERVAREAAAVSEVSARVAPTASVGSSPGSCGDDLSCFLACTRAHESDTAGGYKAVSPDGVYGGAYQFDQTTWNSVASSVGRGDLVGVNPAAASPADQDTLATALYEMRGNQPWGGRC